MSSNIGNFIVDDNSRSTSSAPLTELDSATFSRASSPSALSSEPSSTASLPTRKRKQTATTTWQHSRPPKPGETLRDRHGNRLFYCQYCPQNYGSLTSVRKHLSSEHGIDVDTESKRKVVRQERLDDILKKADVKRLHEQEKKVEEVLESAVNKKALEEALIQLIIIHNLPHTANYYS